MGPIAGIGVVVSRSSHEHCDFSAGARGRAVMREPLRRLGATAIALDGLTEASRPPNAFDGRPVHSGAFEGPPDAFEGPPKAVSGVAHLLDWSCLLHMFYFTNRQSPIACTNYP